MKKIMTNEFLLKESEMDEIVKRVKALIINSKKEILLGYSHNTYQFPGGHAEEGESLIQTLEREILEETGIQLEKFNIEPFAQAIGYYKDWPQKGINRKTEIYYYEILTDKLPNLNNTNYTDSEVEGKFELRYIPLDIVEDELNKNKIEYGDKKGIVNEMLKLLKVYKNADN